MLLSKSRIFISQRFRATYHQQQRTWLPKFARRFLLQYPKTPLYGALGVCCIAFFWPYFDFFHKYMIMDKEEFVAYREHYNKVTRERQKHGTSLYFPFYNDNKAKNPGSVDSA